MAQSNQLPILVITQTQNNAEMVNSTLRGGGHAVHSTWVANIDDAKKRLAEQPPDLIFCFTKVSGSGLREIVKLKDKTDRNIPVIAVAKEVDGAAIAEAIRQGARDLVDVEDQARLQAVTNRELSVLHQARSLSEAQDTIREFQGRFESFMKESGDAIAYVQEGIHVSANPAWLEMFGFASKDDIEGLPVMDLCAPESQGAIKEALRATAKGSPPGEPLAITATDSAGKTFDISLEFNPVEMDGEPAVELAVRTEASSPESEAELEFLRRHDPATGLLTRTAFIEAMKEAIRTNSGDRSRVLVYIKPDAFSAVKNKVGILNSEDVVRRLAELLREHTTSEDLLSRFGGTLFMALVSRPRFKDVESWAEKFRTTVATQVFEAGGQSTSLTVSIGLTDFAGKAEHLDHLFTQAQSASANAHKAGGNRIEIYKPEEVGEQGVTDAGWVKRITDALKQERFQLVYQGVASLQGESNEMYDILVRMLDENGKETMPGDFMPAAERNGLMVAIDRWIMEQAIKVLADRARSRKGVTFFLRASSQSIVDSTLIQFIEKQLAANSVPAGSLVFEVAEQAVEQHLKETRAFVEGIQKLKCRFA
ncbi:MAG: EAL domain-containing protein, partial [Gammaproteobacteria bacterium]